jgi:hypothetical protein
LIFSDFLIAENKKEMVFSLSEPACNGNASYCLPFIDAIGIITKDTPSKLEEFINKNKDEEFNRIIFLESDGGSLIAGIELAYMIKKYEFSTSISNKCYSACAYAFTGGKSREMDEKSKLGVHRFYATKNIGDEKTQHLTVILSKFLDSMGVNRKMLDIASITDSKKMTNINRELAIQLNIVNTVPIFSNWRLEVDDDSTVFTCTISIHKSKKAMGSVCFFYNKSIKKLTGKFIYSIKQKFRNKNELKEIYNSHTDREISFNLNDDYVDLKHRGWRFEKKNTFSTEFIVPEKLTLKLMKEKEFEISGNFSNFAVDVEPKIKFTTKEFGESILAVIK